MNVEVTQSTVIHACLQRMRDGDDSAREQLLSHACDRLMVMARKIKKSYPRVARWEQTEDVFQNATMKLYEALNEVEVQDSLHFFRLAALQIRRVLIDMSRHYQGPQGMGANHHTQGVLSHIDGRNIAAYDPAESTHDPQKIAEWAEVHQIIENLPEDEKTLFDLIWYHDMSQKEVAEVLDVSEKTVQRRWRSARIKLGMLKNH